MSWQASSFVAANRTVTRPSERLVLFALANYAGPDGGHACPSVRQLAWDTHLSERTVQYALKELVRAGVLRVRPDRHPKYQTNIYDFVMAPPGPDYPSPYEGGAESAGVQTATGGVQRGEGGGAASCTLSINNHHSTSELPIEEDGELAEVMAVLDQVSQAAGAPRTPRTTVAAILKDYPDRDALSVAKKILTVVQDGQKVKRVGLMYRKWMEGERTRRKPKESIDEVYADLQKFHDMMKDG